LGTNYAGKVEAARRSLQEQDFVLFTSRLRTKLHMKARSTRKFRRLRSLTVISWLKYSN